MVTRHVVRQELERYESVQACALRLVDHTHATATKFFHDSVMRDGPADERRGVRHLAHILGCAKRRVNEECQLPGQVLINAVTGQVISSPETMNVPVLAERLTPILRL